MIYELPRPRRTLRELGSLGLQSLHTFVLKAVYAALAVSATLCAARLLSLDEFGAFSLLQSVAAIGAVLITFGADQSRLRAVAQAGSHTGQRGQLIQSALVVAAVNAAICLPFVWFGARLSVSDPLTISLLIVVYGLAIATIRIVRGAMVGAGSIVRGQLFEMAWHPALILAAISICWWLQLATSARLLFAIIALTTVMVSFLAVVDGWFVIVRHDRTVGAAKVAQPISMRETWALSFPFLAIALGNVAMSQVDIVMLGALDSAEAAGIGRVLIRVADFAPFLLVAAAVPASRWVARLKELSESESNAFESRTRRMTALATAFAVVFAALCLLFSDYVLGMFGSAFASYDGELAIVLIGRVFFCVLGLPSVFLSMLGYSRQLLISMLLGILINVALNAVLIPDFGVAGAAVATTISIVIWKATAALSVWRLRQINITLFSGRWVTRP